MDEARTPEATLAATRLLGGPTLDSGARITAADVARALVEDGVAPNVSCAVARYVDGAWVREVGGEASLIFDLASLTKPMTAVAVARAGLAREARLGEVLPALASSRTARASIEALLAHRAGLAAHVPLVASHHDAALMLAANAVLTRASDDEAIYSDLGYVLAGEALARHARTADAGLALARFVAAPLGLEEVLGTARDLERTGGPLESRAAPTETVASRGGAVRGRVHDANAWALTKDGGSGHAGMFGTADAVTTFACAVLDALKGRDPRLGDMRTLGWLVAPRAGGAMRGGFDGKSAHGSSVGTVAGANVFGHLGFTGTSFWIDPDADAVVVLLTNRVHPTSANERIRAARPLAHDALFLRARALAAAVRGVERGTLR